MPSTRVTATCAALSSRSDGARSTPPLIWSTPPFIWSTPPQLGAHFSYFGANSICANFGLSDWTVKSTYFNCIEVTYILNTTQLSFEACFALLLSLNFMKSLIAYVF